jgi:hypothetical protein
MAAGSEPQQSAQATSSQEVVSQASATQEKASQDAAQEHVTEENTTKADATDEQVVESSDRFSQYDDDEEGDYDEDDTIEEETLEWADEDDEPEPKIRRKENPANPCDRNNDAYDYEKKWYDDSQIYINSSFCEPALWFDNFFGDDRIFEEGVAGTYVRWRNDFTYDEEDSFKYKTRLAASVQLPGVSNKLHLTFESDEDDDLRDVVPDGIRDQDQSSLGLQVNVNETSRSKFSAKVSLSPKLLLRYRYTYPYNKKVTLRFTQEVERKVAVNSARTRFDYEHTFKKKLLFRSSTEGSVSEDFEGVDWLQALVLFQRLSKRESIAYEASANGISEPRSLVLNYRLGIRFRRNFHREWLFYEVAPEYTWPISLDDDRMLVEKDRRSKFLIFFRLEIHFGNASKKRYQDYY